MTKDILVRGVDEEIYSSIGDAAKEKGISINSLVKDALDSWLNKQEDESKIHHLILYADDKAIANILKSLDYFAKKSGWFRCHCGPDSDSGVKLLDEMKWYNGTILPYDPKSKNFSNYCSEVMQKISKKSGNQPICCVDFILSDIANQKSLSQAVKVEHEYNKSRTKGLMFCPYKTLDLLSAGINDVIELFEEHDQIFILKGNRVYKLHVTLESTHKMLVG